VRSPSPASARARHDGRTLAGSTTTSPESAATGDAKRRTAKTSTAISSTAGVTGWAIAVFATATVPGPPPKQGNMSMAVCSVTLGRWRQQAAVALNAPGRATSTSARCRWATTRWGPVPGTANYSASSAPPRWSQTVLKRQRRPRPAARGDQLRASRPFQAVVAAKPPSKGTPGGQIQFNHRRRGQTAHRELNAAGVVMVHRGLTGPDARQPSRSGENTWANSSFAGSGTAAPVTLTVNKAATTGRRVPRGAEHVRPTGDLHGQGHHADHGVGKPDGFVQFVVTASPTPRWRSAAARPASQAARAAARRETTRWGV